MSEDDPRFIYGLRVAATFATSIAVFVLTYLAAWVDYRQSVVTGGAGRDSRLMFLNHYKFISLSVEDFVNKHGRYPDSFDELPINERDYDPWGHPYLFEKTKDGFKVHSLGRDGKPGGVGLDADFELDPEGKVFIEPTFFQFFFQGKLSFTLFWTAFVSSLCAGMTCYLAGWSAKNTLSGKTRIFISAAVIIIVALGIATFLVACYAGILGSGH